MNRSVFNALKVAAVVLVACWLVSNAAFGIAERNYSKHEQRTLDFAKRKEQLADSLVAANVSLARQRDSLAVVAAEKQKTITKRIEAVRLVPVPPEALPLVDTLNAIIDDQQEVIATQKRALDMGRDVEAKLRRALVASDARGDSLQAFIEKPKPKPRRWGLTVGGGACIGVNGTQVYNGPCLNVGISWRIL